MANKITKELIAEYAEYTKDEKKVKNAIEYSMSFGIKWHYGENSRINPLIVQSHIAGAKLQDNIARQEERERCIKAAKNAFCFGMCSKPCARHMNGSGVENCSAWKEFIKAMEGGEE